MTRINLLRTLLPTWLSTRGATETGQEFLWDAGNDSL